MTGFRKCLAATFAIYGSAVLRIPEKLGDLESYSSLRAYLQRACDRPAFKKAHADQLAHFSAADTSRQKAPSDLLEASKE